MRVFGIDCGTEFTGYGVVEVDCDARMPKSGASDRRNHPAQQKREAAAATGPGLCRAHGSDHAARTGDHGDRRGLLLREREVSVETGTGARRGHARRSHMRSAGGGILPAIDQEFRRRLRLAGKEQVQFMVGRLLENENAFDSPDAADALAIAICHIHTAQTLELQGARR